jgi:hypothetical protein
MNDKKVVIGIFENELNAIIAKRDLRKVGINANILKERRGIKLHLFQMEDGVQLMVPDTQVEESQKILQTRFF